MAKKRRPGKGRRALRNGLIIAAVIIIIAVVAIRFAQQRVNASTTSNSGEDIETAQAEIGTISTTVSGSGTLADDSVEEIDLYNDVEITEFLVDTGDTVEEGDLIASVNMSTVVSSMSEVQSELDDLDAEIADASEEEADDEVVTYVDGRVKVIYAAADDDVASVMYENGALILLSLDGYLSADLSGSTLAEGDKVTVTVTDGTEYSGTVSQNTLGTATILISDKSAEVGDAVTITSEDGSYLGSSVLEIHKPLAITGYAGTVKKVKVSLNEEVDADDVLLTLTDTSYSANYETLLKERDDLEEQLNDLIALYRAGGIYAPVSGTIESLTETETGSSSVSVSGSATSTVSSSVSFSGGSMYETGSSSITSSASVSTDDEDSTTTVVTICPDENMTLTVSVDESDILSLEVGQTASISVDSIEDETFDGTVTDISDSASSSSGVTTYSVEVTLAKDSRMMAGMSATASIEIEGVDNALIVPSDAVVSTRDTSYVYTSYDEETGELGGMVEVTTGLTGGGYTEITSGLSEGDTVYYEETETFDFMSMMSGMSGGGSSFGGGNMGGGSSGFGGGDMPSGGRSMG